MSSPDSDNNYNNENTNSNNNENGSGPLEMSVDMPDLDKADKAGDQVAQHIESSSAPNLRRTSSVAPGAGGFIPTVMAYFFGTLATGIKTFAWWFNQFPVIAAWPFMAKWAISALFAGFEYAPLTKAMQTANHNGVHLGLMTAYMEAADNFLRMMQQLALGNPLSWYDWLAAFLLGVCVAWQGKMHYSRDLKATQIPSLPSSSSPIVELSEEEIRSKKRRRIMFWAVISVGTLLIFILVLSLGGYSGQAYVLATLATGAKTFAWWINQYPILKGRSFYFKWGAGWSIAAFIEYLPLIGAFQVASGNGVHLGLMTAYMEALDNFFRICQQKLLNKPLAWYDLVSAGGMFLAVMFQGIMHFASDHS